MQVHFKSLGTLKKYTGIYFQSFFWKQQNESSLDGNEKFHSQVHLHVTNIFKIESNFTITKERNSCGINPHTVTDWYWLL